MNSIASMQAYDSIIEKVNRASDLEEEKHNGLPQIMESIDDEDRGTMVFTRSRVSDKEKELDLVKIENPVAQELQRDIIIPMKKAKSKFRKLVTLDVDMLPKAIAERQAFEDETLTPLVEEVYFNIERCCEDVSDTQSTP